jgi:flagellar biosynthesis/type III secretory pathway M-ring protein FliF/YscJ
MVDLELTQIKTGVKNCVGIKSDEGVSVDMYTDGNAMLAMATGQVAASGAGGATSTAVSGVTSHVKEIAVGVLAVVSLFLMSSIVKKSAPAPIIVPPPVKEPPQILTAGEMLAGEAAEGGAMLDGMELDGDAIKAQQMVDQVSTMVKENPDSAAAMVKRWLNQG